jgi:hypothetical protein
MVDRARELLAPLPRTLQAGCVLLAVHGVLLVLAQLIMIPAQLQGGGGAVALVGVVLVLSIGVVMVYLAFMIAGLQSSRAPLFAVGYEVLIGLLSLLGARQSAAVAVNLLISIAVVVLLMVPESRAPFAAMSKPRSASSPPPFKPEVPADPAPDHDGDTSSAG